METDAISCANILGGKIVDRADEGPHAGSNCGFQCHSSALISQCSSSKCNHVQAQKCMAAQMDVYFCIFTQSAGPKQHCGVNIFIDAETLRFHISV